MYRSQQGSVLVPTEPRTGISRVEDMGQKIGVTTSRREDRDYR